MFVIRLLVLSFLTFFCWTMGQIPVNEANDIAKYSSFLFFLVAPALYMLPTFEAWNNGQPNLSSIAIVNVFLGWSLVGWVVAAVWAFKKPEMKPVETKGIVEPTVSPANLKKCPFCAEDVLVAAIKCKHCGSQLPA